MISRYLLHTRLLHPDLPNQSFIANYRTMQEYCSRFATNFLKSESAQIPVVLTYSLNRAAEIVKLDSGPVLVYDQFLGQTFNTFHRLYLFGEESWHVPQTLSKMMCEEAICAGRTKVALFYFALRARFNEKARMRKIVSDKGAVLDVFLQELFVFAHEYGHFLMELSPEFRDSRRSAAEAILEAPDTRDPDETSRLLKEKYGIEQSPEEIAAENAERAAQLEAAKPTLQDEVACDDFALFILLGYCKENCIDPRKAFVASFLALRNIRALNYLKSGVSQIGMSDVDGTSERVKLLQFRQHLLRAIYPLVIQVFELEIDPNELHHEITRCSDQHDDKVDNKLLFEFLPATAKWFSEWVPKLAAEDISEFDKCHQLARAMGWGGEEANSYLRLDS